MLLATSVLHAVLTEDHLRQLGEVGSGDMHYWFVTDSGVQLCYPVSQSSRHTMVQHYWDNTEIFSVTMFKADRPELRHIVCHFAARQACLTVVLPLGLTQANNKVLSLADRELLELERSFLITKTAGWHSVERHLGLEYTKFILT